MRSSRTRLTALARVQGRSRSAGLAIGVTTLAAAKGFSDPPVGICRDDLARAEDRAGVGALEQRPQYRHTGRRHVLRQPLGVFRAAGTAPGAILNPGKIVAADPDR